MRPALFIVYTLFIVLSLTLPLTTSAQSIGGLGDENAPFTLSVDPPYPAPYSQATISAQSQSLDLTNATMSVTVAGKKTYQGSVQPTAVTLGKAGSTTKVGVTISSNGTNYSQSVSIQTQDVVLIAEPISSAPPLYPGKPLVPLQGSVRVVAVANLRNAGGTPLDPSTLSYAWTVDDTRIADSSGIGKSAVIVASPLPYRARTVSVAVASQDGSLVGGDSSLSLTPQEPSIRVYENDPLLGIRFERALTNSYSILGAESALYAAPFSMPTATGAPLLQWFLNGSLAQTGGLITLRPAGSGQGNASLSVVASAAQTTATTNLSLTFGTASGSNLFGL
ncbi:MAG: hypothetical protein Q8L52_02115 [bacterium]|nr:hypothetical protein [bacterium]